MVTIIAIAATVGFGILVVAVLEGRQPPAAVPRAQSQGGLPSSIGGQEPGFALVAAPPPAASYVGTAEVFKAHGDGPWDSQPFTIHGGQLVGEMGETPHDATFSLVPVDVSTSTTAVLLAMGRAGGGGGWSTGTPAPPAGTYRLHVAAVAGTSWLFTMQEIYSVALTLDVTGTPANGTRLRAAGTGDRQSAVFPFTVPPRGNHDTTGAIMVGGTFSCAAETTFYLVPAGRPVNPARDLLFHASSQSEGGWFGTVPKSGRYRLVVVTSGQWQIELD